MATENVKPFIMASNVIRAHDLETAIRMIEALELKVLKLERELKSHERFYHGVED